MGGRKKLASALLGHEDLTADSSYAEARGRKKAWLLQSSKGDPPRGGAKALLTAE